MALFYPADTSRLRARPIKYRGLALTGVCDSAAADTPTMPKRKIKLTDAQFDFLTKLVKEPTTAVESYGPARKLVEVGFATRSEGRYGALTHTITAAGLAHHREVYMADKTCGRCKTAPWTCGKCGRKTCEHHCVAKKNDGTAICGRCTR